MHSHPLRTPLLSNALFSLAAGLILALGHTRLGVTLGPDVSEVYLVFGIGLLGFAVGLLWLASAPRPLWTLGVVAADVGWVLGTSTVLVVSRQYWEPTGVTAVVLTNMVVASLALLQTRALARAYAVPGDADAYEVCVRVGTQLDADGLWPVVADLGGIADHMPELVSSRIEGQAPVGEGVVRTCENTRGQRWSERCTRWSDGTSFDVRFLTDDPAFPFPFVDMVGGWRLVPTASGCDVEVWWRVVPRERWLAPVLLPLMAHGAARDFGVVISSMVARAEGRLAKNAAPRLRATFC